MGNIFFALSARTLERFIIFHGVQRYAYLAGITALALTEKMQER